jgi:hypothetical protein
MIFNPQMIISRIEQIREQALVADRKQGFADEYDIRNYFSYQRLIFTMWYFGMKVGGIE